MRYKSCSLLKIYYLFFYRMRKNSKNRFNWKNWKKNNWKNQTMKKNRLNRLEFWKNRPVRFGFGFISLKPKKSNRTKLKPKKTEPNKKNQAEPSRKNQAKPIWTGFCSKQTEPNQNWSVWTGFVFLKKKSVWLLFFL